MNMASMRAMVSRLIKSTGTQYTFTRLGTTLGTAFVTTVNIEQMNSQIDGSTMIETDVREMYVAADMAWAPEVGDDLTCSFGSWHITDVEVFQPAELVIAYKIKVT